MEKHASSEEPNAVSDRAAQAAARVAARFSKAPSYSEMQAAEARAALRTAEAATRAALEAQAAAQLALANLGNSAEQDGDYVEDPPVRQPAPRESAPKVRKQASVNAPAAIHAPAGTSRPSEPVADKPLEIRWEPDMPSRPSGPPPAPSRQVSDSAGDWRSATARSWDPAVDVAIEPVEPARPIQANLIQFPRELVATRRVRPRLTGVPQGEAGEPMEQLSIFEVDPSTISTEATELDPEAGSTSSWSAPGWSSIELDAQPEDEVELGPDPVVAAAAPALHLAPMGLRLMAAVVDFALILGLASACGVGIAAQLQTAPTIKSFEVSAAAALILIGIIYQAFFLLVAKSTPGMMYARLGLCTFEDDYPTRAQLGNRLGALLVSLAPVGLGMGWSLFDEDRLSWHDRWSRTYPRKL